MDETSARRRAAGWSAAEGQRLIFDADEDEGEATQVGEGVRMMTPVGRSNVVYVVTEILRESVNLVTASTRLSVNLASTCDHSPS